jgi:hypothetical protein
MWKHRIRRPSPALVLACLALLVALGGTGYATVLNVPKNSVGTPQLQRNAVKAAKIAPNAVRTGHVLNGALLAEDFKAGQLPSGPKGDKGDKGDKGNAGATNVVVRRSAVQTTAGVGSGNLTASCATGERAVGGGAGLTTGGSTSALTVTDGKPVPRDPGVTPTGWNAGVSWTAAGLMWAVYVICASP